MAAETVGGSAVAVDGQALLILGSTGSGKSALALALIARGARLVADDQVLLEDGEDAPRLGPPAAIAGLIEARGVGLIRLDHESGVPLALVADLDRRPAARLPALEHATLRGHAVPLLSCRDWPGAADGLYVLLSGGRLIDPDRHRAGD